MARIRSTSKTTFDTFQDHRGRSDPVPLPCATAPDGSSGIRMGTELGLESRAQGVVSRPCRLHPRPYGRLSARVWAPSFAFCTHYRGLSEVGWALAEVLKNCWRCNGRMLGLNKP